MRNLLLTAPRGLLFIGAVIAADCSQKRPSGAPSGKDLATLARSKLDLVCTTVAGTTGSGFAGIPVEGYQFWGANPQALSTDPLFCQTAFNQIISQCVESGDFYGGQYFFDGQVFNLTNVMAPKSPKGGNAVSNPGSPPAMPQQNGTPDYADIRCGDGVVGHADAYGRTRWGEAGSEYALDDFNNQWKGGLNQKGLSYVQELSSFWNGPENWDCGVLQNQCGGGIERCGDKDTTGSAGHSVQNPASWQILNSFTNIHNFYLNQFNSFQNARGSLMTQMPEFSKTFSPVPGDDTYIIKIILDVLTMGYGQIAAFAWNVALKKVLVKYDAFKKDDKLDSDKHGWSKDGVNSLVTGMLSLGKDALPKAATQMEATDHLDSLLGSIVDEYANTTAAYVESLFAGDDNAISSLNDTIANGKWIDVAMVGSNQLNDAEMQAIAEKVFYGQLIPAAWSQVGGLHPIVVTDDKICTSNTNGNDGDRYISKDMQDKTGICWKGLGMWILSVNDGTIDGPRQVHQPPGIQKRTYGYPPSIPEESTDAAPLERRRLIDPDDDSPPIFDLLPGGHRDALDGSNWGGIIVDDLIISSYEAYVLNGNKNGYTLNVDDTDAMKKTDSSTDGDTLFNNGVRTPGVFNFPVCSIDTAAKNWKANWMKSSKPQFYPCN